MLIREPGAASSAILDKHIWAPTLLLKQEQKRIDVRPGNSVSAAADAIRQFTN